MVRELALLLLGSFIYKTIYEIEKIIMAEMFSTLHLYAL